MKKILKYVGFTFLGLIGLLSLAAILIINIYRKEILETVNQELQAEINGDINIENIRITIFQDFPTVSLSLRDIYMRGPRYAEFHQDFLKAEIININVEALKLFRKEISIKSVDVINGEVFIFKTRSGYTNLDIFKRVKKKDSIANGQQGGQVNFKNINLKNVAVTFHDSLKRKEFGVHFLKVTNTIALSDSSTQFHILGDLKFVGLMFNSEKGSYLKNKDAIANLSLEFLPRTRQLILNPSTLKLARSELRLSGLFKLADPRFFHLNIQSDSLDYREGVSVLPDSLGSKLAKFDIEKKVAINVNVRGPLIPGVKAAVDMTFSLSNSKVSSNKIEMDQLTLRGSLMNHFDSTRINDHHNILIVLDTLHGKIKGLGFGATLSVQDFENPSLDMKAKFDINLKDLNQDTITDINFVEGRFISSFSYQGKLEEYLDATRKEYEGKLNGVATLTGGEIEYITKQMTFQKMEALVRFTNEQCKIENISMELNKNPVAIKGLFTGFVPFFTQPSQRVKAALTITSPRIDVAQIFVKKKTKKASREQVDKKKRKVSDLLDELYKKLELEIVFDVQQLVNRNFKGENLSGKILLTSNQFQMKGVKMKMAGGQVDFSASLNKLQKEINPFTLSARVKNADIKDFFYAFNNFNQTTIRHENLSGKVNVDIKIKAMINNDLDIMTPSLTGDVGFKLTNGRLRDFAPLQKMSNFLFKNRDLSDVQFGEINAHFNLKGTELDISRMEIQSTILTLYLEGRYSLIDSTDLSIQVPLSNLKVRDQNIPPENIGSDKKVGASVFLRAHKGKDGTTVITYNPFWKLKKRRAAAKGG